MDFTHFARRYVGFTVSILTSDDMRIIGKLASVGDDWLRLTEVQLRDQLDAGGWFERLQHDDPEMSRGPSWPEIVVQRYAIHSMTCLDDAIADVPFVSPEDAAREARKRSEENRTDDWLTRALTVDLIRVEIGTDCIALFDPARGGDGLERIGQCRKCLAEELGLVIPRVSVRDNLRLDRGTFRVLIHDVVVRTGYLEPANLFALRSNDLSVPLPGEERPEPAFGCPGVWIAPADRDMATVRGYNVVEPTDVLVMCLREVARRHAAALLTYDGVKLLLDQTRQTNPVTVDTLVPAVIPLPKLHEVLRRLLQAMVPIKNLPRILESIARHSNDRIQFDALVELVRRDLADPYSHQPPSTQGPRETES